MQYNGGTYNSQSDEYKAMYTREQHRELRNKWQQQRAAERENRQEQRENNQPTANTGSNTPTGANQTAGRGRYNAQTEEYRQQYTREQHRAAKEERRAQALERAQNREEQQTQAQGAQSYTAEADNQQTGDEVQSGLDGRSMQDYLDGHRAKYNPNASKYTQGEERMSSEGLYQDRYNVGYHSENDEGDPYASNAFMGSTKGYFDKYQSGEQDFFDAYKNYTGLERDEGYAGDVLKLIDEGRIKDVTDDQYNMIVTDAQNYDWERRNRIAGGDSGDASYDSRVGGLAGNYRIN